MRVQIISLIIKPTIKGGKDRKMDEWKLHRCDRLDKKGHNVGWFWWSNFVCNILRIFTALFFSFSFAQKTYRGYTLEPPIHDLYFTAKSEHM